MKFAHIFIIYTHTIFTHIYHIFKMTDVRTGCVYLFFYVPGFRSLEVLVDFSGPEIFCGGNV